MDISAAAGTFVDNLFAQVEADNRCLNRENLLAMVEREFAWQHARTLINASLSPQQADTESAVHAGATRLVRAMQCDSALTWGPETANAYYDLKKTLRL